MPILNVLVIESSEDDFGLVVRELGRGRYDLSAKRVQTAFEFAEALERESWGIVLSDWSMPGFSATHALRILKSELLDLPFIIVSGSIGEGAVVAALRSGAHDVLSKGQLARLLPVVDRELLEAQLRRRSRALQSRLTLANPVSSSPPAPRDSGFRSRPSFGLACSQRRGRVLIIDDDVLVLRCLQRALVDDHEVVTATRGAEALRTLAAGERFDIIVCDLMMPEMTGMDLHARLLLAAPEQAARMIFVTGGILSPSVRRFLHEVPNLLLEKPFDPIALRTTINERVACTPDPSPYGDDKLSTQARKADGSARAGKS